jgi:hypothetical protein
MTSPDLPERMDRALSHPARAGIFFTFAAVFSIFGSFALKSIFSSVVTQSAGSFAQFVSTVVLWTGLVAWTLTSLFPKRWRTMGKTCIAALVTYSAVFSFFILVLSSATPANSSAQKTTPQAANDRPFAQEAPPSHPPGTQAVAPVPTNKYPYLPSFERFNPSGENDLFAQARLVCIGLGLEITTNGTTIKCNADEAISLYRRGLLINPGNTRALKELGDLLYGTGKYDAAKQEYDEALSLAPSNVYYMLDVGRALHTLGRHREGDQMFERASRLAKSDDYEFLLALGQTREGLGDLAGALPYYERACKLGDDDACRQAVFARFNIQRPDLQRPAKTPANNPTKNCCDCAPELTNMQCFQKCNAMIPRCGQ